ncbi:MAG: F-type H+-transporting ATPase subunit a [Parcubacteria group bacterium Gr01-1014_18]|nr:MAG: F-type H+-transporting ATPase subunit a [Parcubacteria group bacterium Greene0416_36]TSC80858.1 MAG: F-type H+-transporting ATPase subunit a [Parcubacteria group bacterium Gr01-1014_18]TSC99519.1 MAG: F-type H+-transporting ATPase subunit a [Parcubacteria group bacterium Greene1014_20]TSD07562.1 MAG: F-type H+-transporting ATPase subunit a [Parcubacteria group bacterium Greene0714_2]
MLEISLKAEELFLIGSFPVTNSLLTGFVFLCLVTLLTMGLRRHFSLVPKGIQNFLEWIVESILGMMDGILGGRAVSAQYFPIVATIFLGILGMNWMGLLPGVGSIGIWESHGHESVLVPLFRGASADLNFTLALAVFAALLIQVAGVISLGFMKYSHKFFNFKNPIYTFVGFLELISEFTRVISLSFRLFGNIFAGEVLLMVVAFLVPLVVPLPFIFLEIFVGFVQALVFSCLTLVAIAMARADEAH